MSETLFRGLDRQQLDKEYNNIAKVRDYSLFMKEWSALCETTRTEYPNIKTVCFDEGTGQTMDLIYPNGPTDTPRPVQVFFHGGYWKALSKDVFTFIARAFAEQGIVTAIVDYALIPTVSMDELVRQCRQSIAWLFDNAADHSLDPERIFTSGHSAGGHIVAMVAATDWTAFGTGYPVDLVKGGVGISGLYDLEPIRRCFLQDDLKLSEECVAKNSPAGLPAPKSGALQLVVGGYEGPEYLWQSQTMAAAWPGIACPAEVYAPYNHFTIVSSLADPTSKLATAIRAQMGVSDEAAKPS
ncbi:alpha/beta hydrolase [Sneathiella chinensis]|uniref:Esterase n=1 Tax=Sneathiella chinensis TaxID=349750 RepID=A0ABQ5U2Z0_9PROT|nr:alpha/beta hydrolase [Sneathiella chinensis]GLQ05781.1 esterase [Sneathiella chinensis]